MNKVKTKRLPSTFAFLVNLKFCYKYLPFYSHKVII